VTLLFIGNFKIMIMGVYVRKRMKHLAHILLPSVVNAAWISQENYITIKK